MKILILMFTFLINSNANDKLPENFEKGILEQHNETIQMSFLLNKLNSREDCTFNDCVSAGCGGLGQFCFILVMPHCTGLCYAAVDDIPPGGPIGEIED